MASAYVDIFLNLLGISNYLSPTEFHIVDATFDNSLTLFCIIVDLMMSELIKLIFVVR